MAEYKIVEKNAEYIFCSQWSMIKSCALVF